MVDLSQIYELNWKQTSTHILQRTPAFPGVQHATLRDEVIGSPLLEGDILVSPTNKKFQLPTS